MPEALSHAGYSKRRRTTALVLCCCLGNFGVHRFYTGHILTGILQLLTFGLCCVWVVIDAARIAANTFTDSRGLPLAP